MQRPHQDQKVLEINRGEEALESDGGKVEEPVPVLDSFPVLLLPQGTLEGISSGAKALKP